MPWPARYSAYIRTVLGVQREADIRNIPRVWFWRFDIEGSPEDEIYNEETILSRKYFDPTGVHLFLKEIKPSRGPSKGGVDFKVDLGITISLAEVLRLGEYYGMTEDEEENGYIPHAGDLLQWRNGIYSVTELFKPVQQVGPTRINAVWSGGAVKALHDSTDSKKPVEVLLTEPEQPKWPEEMRSDAASSYHP